MQPIDPTRSALGPLFDDHPHLEAIRDAVLEGRLGRAWVDDCENPTVGRLDLGCYAIFGGDEGASAVPELVATVETPRELIYPDPAWRRRLLGLLGERVKDRPMETYAGDRLDAKHLDAMASALAEGYGMAELDGASAKQIVDGLVPHGLQTFPSIESLLEGGMAWGVFLESAAENASASELVALASSYTQSSRWVEVAISTRPEHRGRGLAAALAARFCLAVLDRGLEPCWSASNPISQRLALRLGFRPTGECEILLWEGGV